MQILLHKMKHGALDMKYKVIIEETLSEEFEVEAKTKEEAIDIAEKKYRNGEIVLEPGNLTAAQMVALLGNENLQETTKWRRVY